MPSSGGTPKAIGALADDEIAQRWPQVLPGGRAVLYTGNNSTGGWENANLMVQPLSGGAPKVVLRHAFHGRYVPSGLGSTTRGEQEGGHLLYMQQGALFAVAFDLARLEVTGAPTPVVDGVASNSSNGGAQFAASDAGTLVYVPGQGSSGDLSISWMDRKGKVTPLRSTKTDWYSPRFSPDGRQLALQISDGTQYDVWVHEWESDTPSRLTFDHSADGNPVWTPDGRRIAFYSDRAVTGVGNIYWQRADGTGDLQRLTDSPHDQRPSSWHPNGMFLAIQERDPRTNWDLLIVPIDGAEESGWKPDKPTVFLNTPANEITPMFSPDGRWMAYASDESGRFEVYVRPFPGPGGKWQISTDGGLWPTWSRAKSELFFASPSGGRIFVVPYTAEGDSFRKGKLQPWSPGRFVPRGSSRPFDVHPDGARFALAPLAAADEERDRAVFVFNFFDELRRLAPVKK